jgi:hypothetical protein
MPFKSKSQVRAFFAMERRGELPKGTAKRWVRHTPNIDVLPEKVAFATGFCKTALINLPEEARQESLRPMQEYVPGRLIPKDTAQPRGRATRTDNVQNEDKEFKPEFHHVWENSRQKVRDKE